MNDTRSDVDPIEPAPLNLKNTDVDFSLAEELPDSADDLLREIEGIYREVTKLLAERKDEDPDYVKGATEALQPLLVDVIQAQASRIGLDARDEVVEGVYDRAQLALDSLEDWMQEQI